MATKKKTEESNEVESIEAVEEKVTTSKKTTSKKSTSTKKKAEETKVEEVKEEGKVEEPAPVVEEVKVEEPKKVEKKAEKLVEKKAEAETPTSGSFNVQVVSGTGIYTFSGPSITSTRGKIIPKGARFTISEVRGSWGKIGEGNWIMITGAVAKI